MAIKINPKNKGKFTAAAKRAGMGVQEYASHVLTNKDKHSPTLVKRASFARNASKWKHEHGGNVYNFGGVLKGIGSAAYGLGEGLLDTVTFNATDKLTDAGFKALQKVGGSTEQQISDQNKIRGIGNVGGAIGGAALTGNVGGAVSQGAKGAGTFLNEVNYKDPALKQGLMLATQAGQMAGSFINPTGAPTGMLQDIQKYSPYVNMGLNTLGFMYGGHIPFAPAIQPVTIEVQGGEDAYRKEKGRWSKLATYKGPSHEDGGIASTLKPGDVIMSRPFRKQAEELEKRGDQLGLNTLMFNQEMKKIKKYQKEGGGPTPVTDPIQYLFGKNSYPDGGEINGYKVRAPLYRPGSLEWNNYETRRIYDNPSLGNARFPAQYSEHPDGFTVKGKLLDSRFPETWPSELTNIANKHRFHLQTTFKKFPDGGAAVPQLLGASDPTSSTGQSTRLLFVNPDTGKTALPAREPETGVHREKTPSYFGTRTIYDRVTGDPIGSYMSYPLSAGQTLGPEQTSSLGVDYKRFGASGGNQNIVDVARGTRTTPVVGYKNGGKVKYLGGGKTVGDPTGPIGDPNDPNPSYYDVNYGADGMPIAPGPVRPFYMGSPTGQQLTPESPDRVEYNRQVTSKLPITLPNLSFMPTSLPVNPQAPVLPSPSVYNTTVPERPVVDVTSTDKSGKGLQMAPNFAGGEGPNSRGVAGTAGTNWGRVASMASTFAPDVLGLILSQTSKEKRPAVTNKNLGAARGYLQQLPTNYNIQPQLNTAYRSLQGYNKDVDQGAGAGAGVRNARRLAGLGQYMDAESKLYGEKLNKETEMLTRKLGAQSQLEYTSGEAQAPRDYQKITDDRQINANARNNALAYLANMSKNYRMFDKQSNTMYRDKYLMDALLDAYPALKFNDAFNYMNYNPGYTEKPGGGKTTTKGGRS